MKYSRSNALEYCTLGRPAKDMCVQSKWRERVRKGPSCRMEMIENGGQNKTNSRIGLYFQIV